MKRTALLIIFAAALACGASAKDIRVVEISTGSAMKSNYDSGKTILEAIAGVSSVVADVTNLILTVTYDADKIGVDEIVQHLNKKEPRFEAKQKGEPKTKKWVKAEKKLDKAEKKVDDAKKEANQRDQQRKEPQGGDKH